MGSSSSKAAKTAAGAARRQYPQRVPPTSSPSARPPPGRQPNAPGPTAHPRSTARETRDEAINLDGQDPHYSASLRSLGAVTPINTLSPSSTYAPTSHHSNSDSDSHAHAHSSTSTSNPPPTNSTSNPYPLFPDPSRNPALQVLTARSQLARDAEREFEEVGRRGRQGRRFLDVVTIRQVLVLRDEKGVEGPEIERRLGLGEGVVGRLGARGVVGDTGMGDDFGA